MCLSSFACAGGTLVSHHRLSIHGLIAESVGEVVYHNWLCAVLWGSGPLCMRCSQGLFFSHCVSTAGIHQHQSVHTLSLFVFLFVFSTLVSDEWHNQDTEPWFTQHHRSPLGLMCRSSENVLDLQKGERANTKH